MSVDIVHCHIILPYSFQSCDGMAGMGNRLITVSAGHILLPVLRLTLAYALLIEMLFV